MTLGVNGRRRLLNAGFLSWEVDIFDSAVDPEGKPQQTNLNSQAWTDMMMSRRAWINHMKYVMGWSGELIVEKINLWYKLKRDRDPWEFLRAEYKPPKRLSDYQTARQQRAEAQTNKLYKPTASTIVGSSGRKFPSRPDYEGW